MLAMPTILITPADAAIGKKELELTALKLAERALCMLIC